jgi:hypothetical protein
VKEVKESSTDSDSESVVSRGRVCVVSAVSISSKQGIKRKSHFIHDRRVRGWTRVSHISVQCGFGSKWDTTNKLLHPNGKK